MAEASDPQAEDSNFPSAMNFQDLLDMSNAIPEECASTLPTANAHRTLPATADRNNSSNQERKINYDQPLPEKIGTLYESMALSDVTFIVGEEKNEIKAHKMILALSSPVFTAMFYGDLANTNTEQQSSSGNNLNSMMTVIEVPDCTFRSFQMLLQFIYKRDEPSLTVDDALSLLYTSRKYAVRGLEDKCCVVLSSSITSDNVFDILYAATFYNLNALDYQSWEFMEDNPVEVLNSHLEFLTHETIQSVLKNDKLNANEVELFKVLMRWAEMECRKKEMEVTPENIRRICEPELKLIRFPTMTGQEFADVVVPTQVLTVDQVAKIFTIINASDERKEAMDDGLLCTEFCNKKRVPKPVATKTALDTSAPPVFSFIAEQVRDREQSVNPGSSTADPNNMALVAASVINPENNAVLLGAILGRNIPALPNPVSSVVSTVGDRNRSRQRHRRNRRRNGSNNNDANSPQPQPPQP